jgi:hypothetical protein
MIASIILTGTTIAAKAETTLHRQLTRQAYETCLSSEARQGNYTASDGGISALNLMDQCRPQLDEWLRDCMTTERPLNQCNLLAASYAQAVLEQQEHSLKP